jgi:hypothetical protein
MVAGLDVKIKEGYGTRGGEIRIPKPEIRMNAEIRMKNGEMGFSLRHSGIRHSDLIRISGFGIRICSIPPVGKPGRFLTV